MFIGLIHSIYNEMNQNKIKNNFFIYKYMYIFMKITTTLKNKIKCTL